MMNYMKTMKAMPQEERPYERCIRQGPQHLSDAELLAVLLRTGRQNYPFCKHCDFIDAGLRMVAVQDELNHSTVLHGAKQSLSQK